MTASQYFSASYQEARSRFRAAAKAAGARLTEHRNPGLGPDGAPLACDVARFGPDEAENLLVTISATHGVEGFCGSGVQVGWFESGLAAQFHSGEHNGKAALLAIHAINPHGFAWLRRVTEDNVDLNRNFVDFSKPRPLNAAYDSLADVICPARWDEATIAETAVVLQAYGDEHGAVALQAAISAGQYSHADGIFYGGTAPTWSRRTLEAVFAQEAASARRLAVIDYHTGLGPRGHGERICTHAPGTPGMDRTAEWYGDDFTSPAMGTSTSVPLHGHNVIGMEAATPHSEVTSIALEYGTQPTELVKLALRADNWLHLHGDLSTPQGRDIKAQIRDAFYQDADDWKEMIWERGIETQKLAIAGLTGG